jgi:biopolymer transport protein ExbD
MAQWDVFRVREFRQVFELDEPAVRSMIAEGRLDSNDCLRRSGETTWHRLATLAEFAEDVAKAAAGRGAQPQEPEPPDQAAGARPAAAEPPKTEKPARPIMSERPAVPTPRPRANVPAVEAPPSGKRRPAQPPASTKGKKPTATKPVSRPAITPAVSTPDSEEIDPLRRARHADVEELDLTAMCDMVFLLVLFFMVTATFTIQKSLDMPGPNPEDKAAKQMVHNLDDLRQNHIYVAIEGDNRILVEDEPAKADELETVLRRHRSETGKNELLIVAADPAYWETVIRVVDAGNEIGVQNIRMGGAGAFE